MKYEDSKFLCDSFPIIYRDNVLGRGPKNTELTFHFECSSGWKNLVRLFSVVLENEANLLKKDGQENLPQIVQVKEKFGGLRIYTGPFGNSTFVQEINRLVESLSFETCEFCGREGAKRRPTFWVKTMCDECFSLWNMKDRFEKLYKKYG